MAETPPITELRDWTDEQWEQLRVAKPYEWVRLRELLRRERRAEACHRADRASDLMVHEHRNPEVEAQRVEALLAREQWQHIGALRGWTSEEGAAALDRYEDAEVQLRELHSDWQRRSPGVDWRKPPPAPPPRELTAQEEEELREWMEQESKRDVWPESTNRTFDLFNEER